MFRRTKVCSGVLVALGGALSLGSVPVFGQQAPQTLERVEITSGLSPNQQVCLEDPTKKKVEKDDKNN